MKVGKILKRSWELFWSNRKIKILALIFSFGSILGSVENLVTRNEFVLRLSLCSLGLGFYVIGILANIGIIKTAARKELSVPILTVIRSGTQYLWRVIGISMISVLPALAPIFALSIFQYGSGPEPVAGSASPNDLLWLIPILLIFVPLAFATITVAQLAIVGVVLGGKRAAKSFREMWNNQRSAYKLATILLAGGFLISNLLARARIFLEIQIHSAASGFLFSVIIWILYGLLNTIITGFTQVSWTLAYKTISRKVNTEKMDVE